MLLFGNNVWIPSAPRSREPPWILLERHLQPGLQARGARLPSLFLIQTFTCHWISFLFPCGTFFMLCPKAGLLLLWVLEVFSLYFFPCVGFLLGFSMHTKPGSKSGSFAAVYCSTRVNVECLNCFEKLLPKIWPACKKVSRERLWNFGTAFLLLGGVVFLGLNVNHLQCTVAF